MKFQGFSVNVEVKVQEEMQGQFQEKIARGGQRGLISGFRRVSEELERKKKFIESLWRFKGGCMGVKGITRKIQQFAK